MHTYIDTNMHKHVYIHTHTLSYIHVHILYRNMDVIQAFTYKISRTHNQPYIHILRLHTYILVINTQTYIRNTHVCMHRLIPNNIQKYVGPTYCIAKTHQYIHI